MRSSGQVEHNKAVEPFVTLLLIGASGFAGRLEGLQNMSQGLGLEAVPSAIGNYRYVAPSDPPDSPACLNTRSMAFHISVNAGDMIWPRMI